MATEHTAVGVRRRSNFWYTHLAGPWSDLGRIFTAALSQAVRVRPSHLSARSRTRESVRCTKSPRPTVLEVFDGSVLQSVCYENAPSQSQITVQNCKAHAHGPTVAGALH